VGTDATESEVVRCRRNLASARDPRDSACRRCWSRETTAAWTRLSTAGSLGSSLVSGARRVSRHAPLARQRSVGIHAIQSLHHSQTFPATSYAHSHLAESSRRARRPSAVVADPRRGSGPGTVRHPSALRPELVAPRVTTSGEPAARRDSNSASVGRRCRPSARRPRRPHTRPARRIAIVPSRSARIRRDGASSRARRTTTSVVAVREELDPAGGVNTTSPRRACRAARPGASSGRSPRSRRCVVGCAHEPREGGVVTSVRSIQKPST